MADYVWAADEQGNLSKCYSSEENRGRGRCPHVFHQNKGESLEQFGDRIASLVGGYSEDWKSNIEPIQKSFDEESIDAMEDELTRVAKAYFKYEDKNLDCNVKIESSDNGYKVSILDKDGNELGKLATIPPISETGVIDINGVEWRFIPVLRKNKTISVSDSKIYLSDTYGRPLCQIDKETGTARIFGENMSLEDLEKRIDLDVIEPTTKNFVENGFEPGWCKRIWESYKDKPQDDISDLTGRKLETYQSYCLSSLKQQLRGLGPSIRRKIKDGKEISDINGTDTFIADRLITMSNFEIAETENPFSEQIQSRKVSIVGLGGWETDTQMDKLRYFKESQWDYIDPYVMTSASVGLNFYCKNKISADGYITKEPSKFPDFRNFQPYSSHCDMNRTAMFCTQIKQIVPVVNGEPPRLSGDPECDRAWANLGWPAGVNLNTVLMPKDTTWEDSCEISESAAKKLACKKNFVYKTQEGESHKVGDFIQMGTRVGGKRVTYSGTVTKVSGDNIVIASTLPLETGDKIIGRHGNKMTISKITPDSEMPITPQGPAEILESPVSIGKRKNISIVMELNKRPDINPPEYPIFFDGAQIKDNYGSQYICRVDQFSREKLLSTDERPEKFGEMEGMLLTVNDGRKNVATYLRGDEDKNPGIRKLMNSIGTDYVEE